MQIAREDFLLEQFKQAYDQHRHSDRMAWTMVSILLPVFLGVFTYGAVYAGKTDAKGSIVVIMALVSIFTLIVMRVMFGRMSYFQDRQTRPFITELEKQCCLSSFLTFDQPKQEQKQDDVLQCKNIDKINKWWSKWNSTGWWACMTRHILTIRHALTFLVLVYSIAWVFLVCESV
jgi:hypothetical protein